MVGVVKQQFAFLLSIIGYTIERGASKQRNRALILRHVHDVEATQTGTCTYRLCDAHIAFKALIASKGVFDPDHHVSPYLAESPDSVKIPWR